MSNATTILPQNHPDLAIVQQIAAAMIPIGAGAISLKDEGTERFWTVQIQPYLIGRFPVTRHEYFLLTQGLPVTDDQRPMVEVSWFDAVRFCNLLSLKSGLSECYVIDPEGNVTCRWTANGYRLPTEAEWEYACRAGSNDTRYGPLDDIAWHRGNADHQPHPVGQKQSNSWGLHDTIGNVWEWCWDLFDPKVYGEYRVFRGGGWNDQPHACRASCRRKSHPTFSIDDLGFRLARTLDTV